MKGAFRCPECGAETPLHSNPFPTADCVIELPTEAGRPGIVLIWRRNEPVGWAIPGGFIDYGEDAESAVRREMMEETGLELEGLELLGVYSDPERDPRFHTISTVFTARGRGELKAGDDAARAEVFPVDALPAPGEIVFDHYRIISDFLERRGGAGG